MRLVPGQRLGDGRNRVSLTGDVCVASLSMNRAAAEVRAGFKVWPEQSPLIPLARAAWGAAKQKALLAEGK